MIFNNGYYNPMDRQYEFIEETSIQAPSKKDSKKPVVGIRDIGQSIIDGQGVGKFNQSVSAAIRSGAGVLELAASAEGSGPGTGVETYSKDEREEIKAMAKINEVELVSVHVPPQQIGNISGFGREGFNEQERNNQMNEIKKHINFAADVTEGASIVVHTGEFPRSLAKAKWNAENKLFEAFPGEEEEAINYLVDRRSGKIFSAVKEDEDVWLPVQERDKVTNELMFLTDSDGKRIIDEFTNKPIPIYETDDQGNIQTVKETFKEFRRDWEGREHNRDDADYAKSAAIAFFREQQQAEMSNALGSAKEFEQHYYKGITQRKQILDQINTFKSMEQNVDNLSEEKQNGIKQQLAQQFGQILVEAGVKENDDLKKFLPPLIKEFDTKMHENERQIAYGRETAISGRKRARQVQDLLENVTDVDTFGTKKSSDSLAQMGIYAMRLTEEKGLSNPIKISPENIFPEMGYGSHPDELIELIDSARKRMVDRLTKETIKNASGVEEKNLYYQQGMSKEEAKSLANKHVRITFDTQHLGMWYRYFKKEQGESEQQHKKRFDNWYMDQVKKLSEKDMVGHVHVVDGFGLGHTHTTVGKGNIPVVEAVEYLKESGFTGTMISEAHGTPQEQLTGTWEAFGSPIYGVSRGAGPRFSDVQSSYFGNVRPPNYVFGAYSPSEDWTLWSQVPFE